MISAAHPQRARRAPRHPTPFVALDPAHRDPLHRQLYDALRAAIVDGRLPAGSRLPSSRQLAEEAGVSRVTVAVAFDQLRAEGYVEGRAGSGTYVCAGLPDDALTARRRASDARPRRESTSRSRVTTTTKATTTSMRTGASVMQATGTYAFRTGLPALDLFPGTLWSKIVARRWRGMVGPEAERLLGYGYALGYPPLRRAIADYVTLARGVRCEASQVIVTSGAQQGLDLAARVLLRAGDAAWLEDPGYFGAREALTAAGAEIVPVPVDAQGMDPSRGEALAPKARLAYVSPSHSYPLGVTMSMPRRLALLDWAARADAWIVEDDYDGEFRYVGRPLASLQGLDAERSARVAGGGGRVLYVGTFSKTLYPSLRLGYLIVPPSLVDAFTAAKTATDRHTATIEQAVLTEFIEDGHFARHVRRMRLVYAARQATLLSAADAHLAEWLELRPASAGMHLVGWLRDGLPAGVTDQALSDAGLADGVVTTAISAHRAPESRSAARRARPPRGGLLLGYAGCSDAMLREGAERLGRAIAAHVAQRRRAERS